MSAIPTPVPTRRQGALAAAVTGPALIGLILGLPGGGEAVLARAVGLPAVVFGLMLVLTPALYIGVAAFGGPHTAQDIARAVSRAVVALGGMLLALAPALAFLAASASSSETVAFVGFAAIALSTTVTLVGLRRAIVSNPAPARAHLLFLVWSLLALGIGARLVGDLLFVVG